MSQPLAEFTHDGIPPLPETPEAPALMQPAPQQGFGAPQPSMAFGIPEFENVPVRMTDGSFRMVEYVTIKTPGDNKAMPRHKVTDALREKYRAYYEAWRRGLEMSPMGTPLEAWPIMDRGTVAACKAMNIFTVEHLAETADSNLHRLPMGRTLKNRARDWLKTKESADAVDAIAREKDALLAGQNMLEKQNADLAEQLRQQRDANDRMLARLDALESSRPAAQSAPAPQKAATPDAGDALDRKIDEKAKSRPAR